MTKKFFSLAAAALAVCVSASAFANSITVQSLAVRRAPTAAETGAAAQPVPAGYGVYQFFVSTDSDILALENVMIVGAARNATYFNNTFGDPNDANPPAAGLEAAFPSITADTYMDTPGVTSRLGAALPGDGITTFGDLDSNGPQTMFKFAQITLPDSAAEDPTSKLNVRISINSTDSPGTPFSQDFSIPFFIPEPASFAMAGMGLIGMIGVARRRK